MRRLSIQILVLNVVISTANSSKKASQEGFAFKLYKAQLMESYNQNRNMVISPSSSYRMLHAFCMASSGKTQKELRQLVSCRERETSKIDKVFRKIDHRRIRNCPQIYTSHGRWDMQRGLRILPEFGSSSAITEMNLRIENKDFDLDEVGALMAINKYYNDIAETVKISDMPNMIPREHIVKQASRIVATDQSIARIPIFSSIITERKFRNDKHGPFANDLPEFQKTLMVTLPNIEVKQIVHLRLHVTAIHVKLPVKDISLVILIPDVENLAEIEEKMTEEDFKVLFSPKFKGPEDIKDDKIIMVNEVVNLTLPIIDSTYVNHHLDKSLLMRYGVQKILKEREAELWGLSPTPHAHLSAMLQRVHFQIVPTNEAVLSEHKKLRRRRNLRNSRASRRRSSRRTVLRSVVPIIIKKHRDLDEKYRLREIRQQAKLVKREKTDEMGAKLELTDIAKYELIMDRPFMYVLKCDESFLQIGRYATTDVSDNRDISNKNTDKKFMRFV